MLGFEKNCHQPFEASEDTGRIDVRKSPTVGTIQSAPRTTSRRFSGAFAATRSTLAATVSRGSGTTTTVSGAAVTAAITRPS